MKQGALEETMYGSDLSAYDGTARVESSTVLDYEPTAVSIYEEAKELREAMRSLFREAAEANWDGDGASPVSGASREWARRFRYSMPPTVPAPELSIDRQGHANFDWAQDRDRVAAAIDERGIIYFIVFSGGNRTRGVIKDFSGAFPRELLDAIRSLTRSR